MTEFEVFKERWRITEWRDGAVYKTKKVDEGWFDDAVVEANRPAETEIIFVPPGSDHPMARQQTIRVKKDRK